MADGAGEANWLSVGKAAQALGISKDAVRKRVAAGSLTARENGGSTKVLLPEPIAAASGPDTARSDVSSPHADATGNASQRDANALAVDRRPPTETEAAAAPADADLAIQVAALTERAEQLAARLAAAEAERDRWVAAAADARQDARAAFAARDDAERELRLLLARAQFAPALPPGADKGAAEPSAPPARMRRRFWRGWRP